MTTKELLLLLNECDIFIDFIQFYRYAADLYCGSLFAIISVLYGVFLK